MDTTNINTLSASEVTAKFTYRHMAVSEKLETVAYCRCRGMFFYRCNRQTVPRFFVTTHVRASRLQKSSRDKGNRRTGKKASVHRTGICNRRPCGIKQTTARRYFRRDWKNFSLRRPARKQTKRHSRLPACIPARQKSLPATIPITVQRWDRSLLPAIPGVGQWNRQGKFPV